MKKGKLALSALASMMLIPMAASADTVGEIEVEVISSSTYTQENLMDKADTISSKGSLQFWSSGGLIQDVPANSPPSEYSSYSLTPKHIEVVVLEEGKSAVAMYYAEGSFHEKGEAAVSHYLTRITEVYVKEGGKWKVRAAHYSPISGGTGTNATAVQ
jgi:hypothetical protein